MNEIERTFSEFMLAIDLADAPDAQVREMKRAFMAGAHLMLNWMIEIEQNQAQNQQYRTNDKKIERWQRELFRFKEDVLAGKK